MPRAWIVIGLGFGDEGKGSVVDHLVRRDGARCVVRFNGGAQARHHVVAGAAVHGFSQFGAGTLAGARTLLSRYMLVEPLALCGEARDLAALGVPDPFARITISAAAPIITQANILANRAIEAARGPARHGSCGLGIGLTQGDAETLGEEALRAGDLARPAVLREKLALNLRRRLDDIAGCRSLSGLPHQSYPSDRTAPAGRSPAASANAGDASAGLLARLEGLDLADLAAFYGEFAARVRIVPDGEILHAVAHEDTVFEGAQGVLLDQRHGFFPHVTRSNTTFENADALLAEAGFAGERVRIGLLRPYSTRHGAGPLPTETSGLSVPPCHNGENAWQGAFRVGWFDAVAARYALAAAGGVGVLGITGLDRLAGLPSLVVCTAYRASAELPDGVIPPAADRQASLRRTAALFAAQPVYAAVAALASCVPADLWRFADAIGELVRHPVGLISARPDAEKLWRAG
ncbi:MAG TPA: adenylosuccinate synthetase [Chthonomonadaceae bacterium]|nr:adenylosuccinate synthetase [Chthonomonadaceae bacterium]